MDINNLTDNEFIDIFSDSTTQIAQDTPLAFGGDGGVNIDLLGGSTTETTTLSPSTDDTTTLPPTDDADITGKEKENEPIDDSKPVTTGRKPKYDFSDASGYFADRFKSGKFVAIEEELEDGTKRPFIPKTPEEFDEVIEIQVNHRFDEKTKDIDKNWYQSKSPAWQAVAKYAEMTNDPAELLPFIQGVKTIDSVAEVDENEIDGAELIIRTRLLQRGESEDIIDSNIEALKTTDKLVETAKKYKPLILQQEKAELNQMYEAKRQEDTQRQNLISSIRENAIKAIESPLFEKIKLKQDEKAAIYDLIGEPDQESQGYPIYSAIDNLFEKGDFDTLRQVALLLTKKDSYLGYISQNASQKTAEGIQRQLRVATDSRNASTNDDNDTEDRKVVTRRQYTTTPRFGR